MIDRPSEKSAEPSSDPPFLNPTASWLSGDAWHLFREIADRCGVPTAKYIFTQCIAIADEQENRANAIKAAADVRRKRPPIRLPTAEQIARADRHQICVWWARLRGTDQIFSDDEKKIIAQLSVRYVDVGGYTEGFNENHLPPVPMARNEADAVLVGMFDRRNPDSAYCIERAKRGGKLTVKEFASTLVPAYGTSADHILRKLKYQRSGN